MGLLIEFLHSRDNVTPVPSLSFGESGSPSSAVTLSRQCSKLEKCSLRKFSHSGHQSPDLGAIRVCSGLP